MPPPARKRARCTLATNAAEAVVVEAEPVDQRLGLGQAEHARLRVAGLRPSASRCRPRCSRSRARPGRRSQRPFLSSPAARPMRFGKRSPASVHRVVDARAARRPQMQRRALDARQRAERQVVRRLGVEAEQERAGQGVGNSDMAAAWEVGARRPIVANGISRRGHTRAASTTAHGAADGRATHRTRHLRRDRRRRRPPVGRADAALAAALRDLDRAHAARADRARWRWSSAAPRASTASSACSTRDKADAIVAAADEVLAGRHDDAVPARRSGRPARARRPT